MQDKTIIEFQHGDKASYRLVFNLLYPVMCSFSMKFVGNYDDAEDITQEVFIELWHQRAKFESLNQIKAFLYLSIKNRCLNFKKHQIIQEEYAKTTLADTEQYFEENVIEAEVIRNLNNAINNLPAQRQQIILLSLQGLKNNEIAESMHISINTVKLHKKIAYKQLRDKFGPSLFVLAFLF